MTGTVILKIHGAVDRADDERDSFVITQDHYTAYLTRTDIASLIPVPLAAKLKKSHLLFLDYGLRDWNLRVILHRIWGETDAALDALERAVELDPTLDLDPVAEVTRVLIEEGRALAGRSAYDEAEELLGQAVVLDPTAALVPEAEVAVALAVEISLGETVTGTVEAGGHNVYMFEGTAGQVVSIEMNAHDSMPDPYVNLWGPGGARSPETMTAAVIVTRGSTTSSWQRPAPMRSLRSASGTPTLGLTR